MVEAKQTTSVVQPGQVTAVSGVAPAELDIGSLVATLTPLLTLVMFVVMLMPMMRSMSEAMKSTAVA